IHRIELQSHLVRESVGKLVRGEARELANGAGLQAASNLLLCRYTYIQLLVLSYKATSAHPSLSF
ncbi:hypothetical protein TorRG33x02_241030, partial [Trema orientale]